MAAFNGTSYEKGTKVTFTDQGRTFTGEIVAVGASGHYVVEAKSDDDMIGVTVSTHHSEITPVERPAPALKPRPGRSAAQSWTLTVQENGTHETISVHVERLDRTVEVEVSGESMPTFRTTGVVVTRQMPGRATPTYVVGQEWGPSGSTPIIGLPARTMKEAAASFGSAVLRRLVDDRRQARAAEQRKAEVDAVVAPTRIDTANGPIEVGQVVKVLSSPLVPLYVGKLGIVVRMGVQSSAGMVTVQMIDSGFRPSFRGVELAPQSCTRLVEPETAESVATCGRPAVAERDGSYACDRHAGELRDDSGDPIFEAGETPSPEVSEALTMIAETKAEWRRQTAGLPGWALQMALTDSNDGAIGSTVAEVASRAREYASEAGPDEKAEWDRLRAEVPGWALRWAFGDSDSGAIEGSVSAIAARAREYAAERPSPSRTAKVEALVADALAKLRAGDLSGAESGLQEAANATHWLRVPLGPAIDRAALGPAARIADSAGDFVAGIDYDAPVGAGEEVEAFRG